MVEKITKYKIYIILVAIILVLTIFFVNIKYLLPKKYGEIPEVKLREIKDTRAFAIMIPNENGDDYVEYTGDTWPIEEYAFKEAKCTDNNGTLVVDAITFADGKAILTTNQTVYCTLYFDVKPPLNLRTLCENYNNMQTCMKQEKDNIGKVTALSNELVGGMYRYQGLDKSYNEYIVEGVPFVENNYICFGTTDSTECTNENENDKYMYRIIGITPDGQLKLLKDQYLKSNGDFLNHEYNDKDKLSFPYDGETGECDGDKCDWPNTTLFKDLNGIGTNNIFVNSGEYDFLKFKILDEETNEIEASDWYNLIENYNWWYGSLYSSYSNPGGADYLYEVETGESPSYYCWPEKGSSEPTCKWELWTKSISAKIGILYIHDIGFSYNDLEPNASWLYNDYNAEDIVIENAGVTDGYYGGMMIQNVLFTSVHEWESSYLTYPVHIRPVFYLNSSIKIKSGDGTESDPFILEV